MTEQELPPLVNDLATKVQEDVAAFIHQENLYVVALFSSLTVTLALIKEASKVMEERYRPQDASALILKARNTYKDILGK